MVTGAHLVSSLLCLFPHSLLLFPSYLPFSPHLLGSTDRPGNNCMCLHSVVVDVEAKQRTGHLDHVLDLQEFLTLFTLVKLIATLINLLKSCIYFNVHSV